MERNRHRLNSVAPDNPFSASANQLIFYLKLG